MSKTRIVTLAICAALIGGIGVYVASPLHRSEASIRASLLRQTPLGSSSSEVRALLEQRGWLNRNYHGTTGYYYQPSTEPARTVGVTSLSANLGDYGFPFRTNVSAFWGFDRDDRLIDIWVWKTTDAL
jgi:hypothetical protein